ncbi:MAG: hypothetical protein COB44_06640 [Idiomarina sp.]|nr:MAG: hypothetical protein COB44_06640 [Idiomarina sp.]
MHCHNCNKDLAKPSWFSFSSKTINCPYCGEETYAKFSLLRFLSSMIISFVLLTLVSQLFLNDKGLLEIIPILLVGPLSFYFAWKYEPKNITK